MDRADCAAIFGLMMIVTGTWMWSHAAAFIVAGLCFLRLSFLIAEKKGNS